MEFTLNNFYYQWKRNNWLLYPKRFFSNYNDIKINKPIFFVGNQGGGLTLVARVLRRHKDIVSISGNNDYWSGADEMQKVMLLRLPPSLRLSGKKLRGEKEHPLYTPPRSWSYSTNDLHPYYRNTEKDFNEKDASVFKKVIREALHRFAKNKNTARFLDKSQVYSVKLSYLNKILEGCDPYFVLITRDPYASCYRAALGKAGDMKRYAEYISLDDRVKACAEHWYNATKAALDDKDKVAHFAWYRFEDFLREPEKYFRQLCTFLEIEYDPDMIPAAHHKLPFGSKYEGRWFPLKADVNDSYLKKIPEKYVRVIDEHCGDIAKMLGYEKPKGIS